MAKEGIFGEAGKNSYTIPGVTGFFSNEVNKSTGITQVYLQGPFSTQQSVGTYNPSTKKFTVSENSSLNQSQIKTISSSQGLSVINTQSQTIVSKELQKQGATPAAAQKQTNDLLSGNKASSTGTQVSTAALQESLQSSNKTRNTFPQNLVYPSDLQIKHQDVIRFSMLQYDPKSFSTTLNEGLGGFEKTNINRKSIGSVTLPIPSGISDTNAVNWGSDSMNPAQAALANIALTGIMEGGEAAADKGIELIKNIGTNAKDVQVAIAARFAEAATGTSSLLSRTQGAILNPNMELLFNSPTLRPFTFTFRLSARGAKDRDQIRQIIRFFKQGMAVQRTEAQLFLKAPHTFKIQYLHKEKDHPYINRIKECALQSFTVNYTPDNSYMTFADGLMTSYEIQMQFQELEPVFNDDYTDLPGGNSDREIGY